MKYKTSENRNIYNIDRLHVENHLYMHKTKTSDANYLLNQYISLNFRKEMYVEWLRLISAKKVFHIKQGRSCNFMIFETH